MKWLNLRELALRLIDHNTEYLGGIYWCSARDSEGDMDKYKRHVAYQKALESVGVETLLGHFANSPMRCQRCSERYEKRTEKASDVNVALYAVSDALGGQVESIYLITADTDQAATATFLHQHCSDVRLTIVAPPGRMHSQHLLEFAHAKRTIEESTLIDCVFPKNVTRGGKHVVDRPDRYNLPLGFVTAKAKGAAQQRRPVEIEIKKKRLPKLAKS